MNKRMKESVLLLTSLLSACPVLADGDNDAGLIAAGSHTKDYWADQISRIEFGETGITVVKSDQRGDTYLFDTLEKIVFDRKSSLPGPNAIGGVVAEKQPMTLFVARDGSVVSVRGWQGEQAEVSIYAASGAKLVDLKQWRGADINVGQLPHGVYVIKVGDKSAKFRK